MKLSDLDMFPHPWGFQYRKLFDNGYGVSVIPERDSHDVPLYEVGVLRHKDGKKATLTYESPITADVLSHLTESDVERVLDEIVSLPPLS